MAAGDRTGITAPISRPALPPYREKEVVVPPAYESIAQECEALYAELHQYRIR